MTCTFFGNRNISDDIQPKLQKLLEELIENNIADKFYVGNHGRFDIIVLRTLRNLKKLYPHIQYNVVLAYIPTKKDNYYDFSETVYPDKLENTPFKFAIDKRNRWMIDKSDLIVSGVKYKNGCSAKYLEIAKNKKKTILFP